MEIPTKLQADLRSLFVRLQNPAPNAEIQSQITRATGAIDDNDAVTAFNAMRQIQVLRNEPFFAQTLVERLSKLIENTKKDLSVDEIDRRTNGESE